jgi:hypothetical protein
MTIIHEYQQKNNILRDKKSIDGLAFVYVPKTGGTFLNISVLPNSDRLGPKNSPRMVHMPTSKVLSLTKDDIKLFTLVRDPYDLACSEYFFLKEKVEYNTKYFNLNKDEKTKAEVASRFVSKLTDNESYYEKLIKIYLERISLEDYLEFISHNPIYPFYYDVRTPKSFHCVGVTEEMEKTIYLLEKMFGVICGKGNYNKNLQKNVKSRYISNYSRDKFKKENNKDYEMYYEGVEKFNSLWEKYGLC